MDITENKNIFTHAEDGNSTNFSGMIDIIKNYQAKISELIAAQRLNCDQEQHYLNIIEKFSKFNLGRFILKNRGLNGFWADYLINYPKIYKPLNQDPLGEPIGEFEHNLLTNLPVTVATQERHVIFLREAQKRLVNNMKVLSVPCGLASEILQLDYSSISNIELTGIDIDSESLDIASKRAQQIGLDKSCTWLQEDAWKLPVQKPYDLIISNGLTMYIADDQMVLELYKLFYKALNSRGTLITSYITPPPYLSDKSTWLVSAIKPEYQAMQENLFHKIFDAKWHGYRTTEQTIDLLTKAGFDISSIQIYPDNKNIFPTVVAIK